MGLCCTDLKQLIDDEGCLNRCYAASGHEQDVCVVILAPFSSDKLSEGRGHGRSDGGGGEEKKCPSTLMSARVLIGQCNELAPSGPKTVESRLVQLFSSSAVVTMRPRHCFQGYVPVSRH